MTLPRPLRCLLLAVLVLAPAGAHAQEADALYLSSRRAPVRLTLGAAHQTYEVDGLDLSETSIPLTLSAPLGTRFGVSVVAHQATASGEGLADLSGVSDVQLGLSYYTAVGAGSIVASLGLNLPSGLRELSAEEFTTAVLLSQHVFAFHVPGFGQGFNVAPGLVAAYPVADGVVLGLGAAYQRTGVFAPLDGLDDYDPGDEITLTGGLDVRTGLTANLSAEITYTHYTADEVDGAEVFTAGGRLSGTVQYLQYLGQNELRLAARLRSPARSTLPATFAAEDEELRTIPTQTLLMASYRPRLTPAVTLGLLARARLYGATEIFAGRNAFDAGLLPTVGLSPTVRVQARFVYTAGDVTGFDAGAGLVVEW